MILMKFTTSTSIGEAQSSASQLVTLVQQVLDSNLEISQRIANIELQTLKYQPSSAPTLVARHMDRDDDSIDTTRAANIARKGENAPSEHVETVNDTSKNIGSDLGNVQYPTFRFTFDEDLNSSRPYARAMKRNSLWSTASSAVHTIGWSFLSGLSIANVSAISVIGLPISPQELWNGHRYIFTGPDTEFALENIRMPAMEDALDSADHRLTRNERFLEIRKGVFLHDSIQGVGENSVLKSSSRCNKKVPVPAGGKQLENDKKRITLLCIIQSPLLRR